MRREIQVSSPSSDPLAFLVSPDDDVTIFVNGHEAATAQFSGQAKYQIVTSNATLQPGRNVIAAKCVNNGGAAAVHVVPGHKASDEALIPVLSAALDADPGNEALLQQRAELYASLGRWDEAAADYVAILQLHSQAPGWTDGPGWHSQRSKLLPAVCADEDLFHALRRQLPDSPDLWLARARCLALRSHWSAAAEAYARYDGPRPVNSEIAFEIACVQQIVGDDQAYRESFNGLREQAGEDPTPFAGFTLARAAGLVAQEPDLAQQAVGWGRHGLTETREAWRLNALGLALFRAGDIDGATEILEESFATGWSDNQNQAALALVCHDAGDDVQAQELLSAVRTWVLERKKKTASRQ